MISGSSTISCNCRQQKKFCCWIKETDSSKMSKGRGWYKEQSWTLQFDIYDFYYPFSIIFIYEIMGKLTNHSESWVHVWQSRNIICHGAVLRLNDIINVKLLAQDCLICWFSFLNGYELLINFHFHNLFDKYTILPHELLGSGSVGCQNWR